MTITFVTGATGFIGNRLVNSLEGEIRILSRIEHPDFQTIICDLSSEKIPVNALKNVDTVFHLAGFTHDNRHGDKVADQYYKINVSATIQLANLSVRSGVKKFIFISSVKAGGRPLRDKSLKEHEQSEPDGIYGRTKREAEIELLKIAKDSSMHVSIIRPSLVYGPNVKGNLKLMLFGIQKGWFPPLPLNKNMRSMVHVDDLVAAIRLVSNCEKTNGEIYNVTDNEKYSTRDIYETICVKLGKKIPNWYMPYSLLYFFSKFHPKFKILFTKLFDSECYSSEKINKIGFIPKKKFKDFNT